MADGNPIYPAVEDSLALALVAASDAPIVLLDGQLRVIAASQSFTDAFHLDPATIAEAALFALGAGEWDAPPLRALLEATLAGAAASDPCEMDLDRPGGGRRLILSAHRLDYAGAVNVRLLLAVSDVTDARLAERLRDDLLRQKATLFEELQHRVANSLQIIASILMLSARRTPSGETRGNLFDAHSRVMSVAALQQQLATTQLGEVALRPYFAALCASIGAAMIHDGDKIRLAVEADEADCAAEASVSLGLIVTELVINALKHAFPVGARGHIIVGYRTSGEGWTLSVSDNGVGMAQGGVPAAAGLGSSIVAALAKQLGASVERVTSPAGTTISVAHGAARAHVARSRAQIGPGRGL